MGSAHSAHHGADHWDRDLPRVIDTAIHNVLAFGDTDLFPDPIESRWIHSAPRQAREAVLALHRQFETGRAELPELIRALFPVGHAGYRLGSQIDPVWNLYLLSLVIIAGPSIEATRPSRAQEAVFSFRFTESGEQGRIFDPECGWRAFTQRALAMAGTHAQAIVCDISDFYHRIAPGMAKAALARAGVKPALARRIAQVLKAMGGDQMGLPIGGPASRLIAEAVLCEIDQLLHDAAVSYCRFVDDLRLFTPTRSEAQHALALLSRQLMLRGFSLQKSKTRILPGSELAAELAIGQGLQLEPSKGDAASPRQSTTASTHLRQLLTAPVQFDPYSGLRAQRDVRLEAFAQDPGALPLLRREFSKSRINPSLARNMLSALAFMSSDDLDKTLTFLLDARRQTVLLPVVGKLLTVTLEQVHRLGDEASLRLRDTLLTLLAQDGVLLHLPSSQSQALRVLQSLPATPLAEPRALLQRLFDQSDEVLVRREVLGLWGRWGFADEIEAIARRAPLATSWERRALVAAMAHLGGGGVARQTSSPRRRPAVCEQAWLGWLDSLPPSRVRGALDPRVGSAV